LFHNFSLLFVQEQCTVIISDQFCLNDFTKLRKMPLNFLIIFHITRKSMRLNCIRTRHRFLYLNIHFNGFTPSLPIHNKQQKEACIHQIRYSYIILSYGLILYPGSQSCIVSQIKSISLCSCTCTWHRFQNQLWLIGDSGLH